MAQYEVRITATNIYWYTVEASSIEEAIKKWNAEHDEAIESDTLEVIDWDNDIEAYLLE